MVAFRKFLALSTVLCGFSASASATSNSFVYASWNIGHFALGGAGASKIKPADGPARAEVYRAFLAEVGADAIGVAEYSDAFTTDGAMRAPEAVFGKYPVFKVGPHNSYQWNSQFFREGKVVDSRTFDYPKRDQRVYYIATRVEMAGREIVFVATHLDWKSPDKRADQLRILAETFAGEKYVVVSGDFNVCCVGGKVVESPSAADEFAVFAKAGYSLANDGSLVTWPAGKLGTSPRRCAIDNIMTKGFSISDVKVWDRGDLSDHALISARLTFADKEAK